MARVVCRRAKVGGLGVALPGVHYKMVSMSVTECLMPLQSSSLREQVPLRTGSKYLFAPPLPVVGSILAARWRCLGVRDEKKLT